MTDDEKMPYVALACGWTVEPIGKDVNGETWWWCNEFADHFTPLHDANDMLEIVAKLSLLLSAGDVFGTSATCLSRERDVMSTIPADGDMQAALKRAAFEVAVQVGMAMKGDLK